MTKYKIKKIFIKTVVVSKCYKEKLFHMLQLVRTKNYHGWKFIFITLSDIFQLQRRRTAFSFWSRRSQTVTSRSADRHLSRAVLMLHDPAALSTSTTAHWTRSKSSWSIRTQDASPETSSSGTETLSHMQMKATVCSMKVSGHQLCSKP